MYCTRPAVIGSSAPPKRRRLCLAFFATPRFLPRSRVRNTTIRSDSPSLYVRRISASVVWSIQRRGGILSFIAAQADVVEDPLVLAPFGLHADVEIEKDLPVEERLQLLPGGRP